MNGKNRKAVRWLLLTAILLCSVILGSCSQSKEPENFTQNCNTKNYNLDVVVKRNNVYDVTETITVDFTSPSNGIIRTIPYKGEIMRTVDGSPTTVAYRININNLKVESGDYSVVDNRGKLKIYFGKQAEKVSGRQTYRFSYQMQMYDDKIDAFDEMNMAVTPIDWTSPVETQNLHILMPEGFQKSNLKFYSNNKGDNRTTAIPFTIKDNTISAYLEKDALTANPNLSVQLVLPEGYFKGEKTLIPLYVLLYLLLFLLPVGALVLWILLGRNGRLKKTFCTVPPKDMTPLEMGYYLRRSVEMSDIIAMFSYWAANGYLLIQQQEGTQYSLVKQAELPSTAKSFEVTLFEQIFKNGDMVSMHELTLRLDAARKMIVKQLASFCKAQVKAGMITKQSRLLQWVSFAASILPIGIFLAIAGYVAMDESSLYVAMGCCGTLLLINVGWMLLRTYFYSMEKTARLICGGILALFDLIVHIAVIGYGNAPLGMAGAAVWAAFAGLLMIGIALLTGRRTQEYTLILEKVLGFRRFVRRVDVSEYRGTNYFYFVLPYAYVLRLSEVWAKQFEKEPLSPPLWFQSAAFNPEEYNVMVFARSFHLFMDTVLQLMAVRCPKEASTAQKEQEQRKQNRQSGFQVLTQKLLENHKASKHPAQEKQEEKVKKSDDQH